MSIGRSQLPDTPEKAEDIWEFILEVLARSKSERVAGMIAAGPMEDLLDGGETSLSTASRRPFDAIAHLG